MDNEFVICTLSPIHILNINGENKKFEIEPGEMLIDTLRAHGYYGPKRACSSGNCGACTIIMDGEAVNSCMVFSASVGSKKLETVEGLGTVSEPHPLQKNFVDEGAVQCGYCIPGMLMSSKALLDKNDNPSRDEVKEALSGNLCRCTGYVKQIEAVLNTAAEMRGGK